MIPRSMWADADARDAAALEAIRRNDHETLALLCEHYADTARRIARRLRARGVPAQFRLLAVRNGEWTVVNTQSSSPLSLLSYRDVYRRRIEFFDGAVTISVRNFILDPWFTSGFLVECVERAALAYAADRAKGAMLRQMKAYRDTGAKGPPTYTVDQHIPAPIRAVIDVTRRREHLTGAPRMQAAINLDRYVSEARARGSHVVRVRSTALAHAAYGLIHMPENPFVRAPLETLRHCRDAIGNRSRAVREALWHAERLLAYLLSDRDDLDEPCPPPPH